MDKTPQQLAIDMIKRSFIRFGKVFIASGIAAAALIPPLLNISYHDLKSYISALIIAFVSGGVLGVEKILSQLAVPEGGKDQSKNTDLVDLSGAISLTKISGTSNLKTEEVNYTLNPSIPIDSSAATPPPQV